jgi:hypothetical protein
LIVTANRKDLAVGAIFIGLGLIYGYLSLTSMSLGTPTRMGPGFFPAMLSGLIVLVGAIVLVRAFVQGGEVTFETIPWRPIGLLTLAIVIFAAFADQLGMLPATFLTAGIAALAKRETKLWQAAAMGLCIAAFCSLVFTIGLGLPLPILGSWFR